MRYDTPDDPELGGSWVEYSDRWSRAEWRQLAAGRTGETDAEREASGLAWLALVAAKTVGLHLLCADGSYLDDPAQLTEADLDRVEVATYLWWTDTPWALRTDLANRGNASRRRLLGTAAGQNQDQATPIAETATANA